MSNIFIFLIQREERLTFIKCKYEEHKYAIITCTYTDDLKQDLKQAILTHDIGALLQVYAEGMDLMTVLPDCVSISVSLITIIGYTPGKQVITSENVKCISTDKSDNI